MEFPQFNSVPVNIVPGNPHPIYCFNIEGNNLDEKTVAAFSDEWKKFNSFTESEINDIASAHYFDIVPVEHMRNKALLDVGCGSGRWTKYAAKFAQTIDAIDPSSAIESAASLLSGCQNVRLSKAAVDNLPFPNESFDFVFSLGVLHHIPDTAQAMERCVKKLKPGGYFLTYLYYDLDNRGALFKSIFFISNIFRHFISALPHFARNFICDIIAVVVYMPFIMISSLFKKLGHEGISAKLPLHFYVGKTYHVIRNDARDRFGTPLEQRFTKSEIEQMMCAAGLSEIVFSKNEPYWHAIGKKV